MFCKDQLPCSNSKDTPFEVTDIIEHQLQKLLLGSRLEAVRQDLDHDSTVCPGLADVWADIHPGSSEPGGRMLQQLHFTSLLFWLFHFNSMFRGRDTV